MSMSLENDPQWMKFWLEHPGFGESSANLDRVPPISPHDHPESQIMTWTELEIQWIRRFAASCYELGRAAGREEATAEVARNGASK